MSHHFETELETLTMAGAVTATTARIWARSDRPGAHTIELEPGGIRREVTVEDGPGDHTGAWTCEGLEPGTPYRFRVTRGDRLIGEGAFRTAPAPGKAASFSFAAMSCNQPFADDGRVGEVPQSMLVAARQMIRDRDAAFMLAMGDQMYADAPEGTSLFEDPDVLRWSRAEVRTRYQQRYRRFWAVPELQALYGTTSSWPMLDDHEVVDDFGSVPVHASAAWRNLREGALDAYYDYQASRVLDERRAAFDHGFRWDGAAVYQLDIRSERTSDGERTRVLSPSQLARFTRFLGEQHGARVLVVMVSVPLAFVPTWAASLAAKVPGHGADGMDRWSHARCEPERNLILKMLHDHAVTHPWQQIVLVTGDVHVGAAHSIRWPDGVTIHQLTTSAVTNHTRGLGRNFFEPLPRLQRRMHIGETVADVEMQFPPYGQLNIGFVHIEDDGKRARVQLELAGVQGTVYRSPWLG